MAELVLPPLPAKRQRSAVLGALELLALDAPESLAIGFGRRGEDGKVPVCWTANSTLQTVVQTLQQHGLPVQALSLPWESHWGLQERIWILPHWIVIYSLMALPFGQILLRGLKLASALRQLRFGRLEAEHE